MAMQPDDVDTRCIADDSLPWLPLTPHSSWHPSGPGSLVIEPASACHAPQVLGDGTDDAILFILIGGDVQLLDFAGQAIGVEDCRTAMSRYLACCRANDLVPRNVTAQACADECSEVRGLA